MSEDSKEAMSSANTSKNDEEVQDSSMEQDDGDSAQDLDKSEDKSGDEKENGDSKKTDDVEEDKEGEEEEEEEEEEESDDEPQVGLLEKPLVLEEGKKRERKKVERISFENPGGGQVQVFEIKEGKGRSLGDIPYIEFRLSRTKAEDLKPLHRLLFRRVGTALDVKKNIRQFSGFPFSSDDTEYEKRLQMLRKQSFTIAMIKRIMDVFDIPRGGTKEELITRLMEWLEKPKDSGKKIPNPKRKRKSKEGSKTKSKSKKGKKTEKKKKQAKKESDDEGEEEEDVEDEEAEEEDEEEEEDKEESDEEDVSEDEEEPPKKKTKKSTPKATKEKEKKPKGKETAKAKPAAKKKATPQKKKASSEVSDVGSDSDEEPLVAHISKGPPTNDELKDVIKKMLDNANLEQVTMKTVLKDVFAKYPDFDLTDRKDFIKNTVKQIIS